MKLSPKEHRRIDREVVRHVKTSSWLARRRNICRTPTPSTAFEQKRAVRHLRWKQARTLRLCEYADALIADAKLHLAAATDAIHLVKPARRWSGSTSELTNN